MTLIRTPSHTKTHTHILVQLEKYSKTPTKTERKQSKRDNMIRENRLNSGSIAYYVHYQP